jgi:hypothetical protein
MLRPWQEDQIQELYMVRRTVCEMLVDRGYLLPSDSCAEEGLTLDQVFELITPAMA